MGMLVDRRHFVHFDWVLLALVFLIPALGLVVLYSAGFDPDGQGTSLGFLPVRVHSAPFARQFLFLWLASGAMVVSISLSPGILLRMAYPVYAVSLLLLVIVFKAGVVSNGARRWFALGFFNFQPAELMKIAVALALARYLSKHPPRPGGYRLQELLIPFALFLVPMALVAKQPDLGTGLVIGAIGFGMTLFVGITPRALMSVFLPIVITLYPAWHYLIHDYQKMRILVLFDPQVDPLGSGYHIMQSKIAVGSGGLLGRGFLEGTQSQLEFLPEHTTDFVFSVLAEEWGFIGCLVIIGLFAFLVTRMLGIVARGRDYFSILLATGVCVMFGFHVIVNIGMVVGLLPVVGIPLPLFSYGGSALVVNFVALGLVMGVGMRRFLFTAR